MHLDNVPRGRLCSWELNKGRLLLVSYLGKRKRIYEIKIVILKYWARNVLQGQRPELSSRKLTAIQEFYHFHNNFLIKSPDITKRHKRCPSAASCSALTQHIRTKAIPITPAHQVETARRSHPIFKATVKCKVCFLLTSYIYKLLHKSQTKNRKWETKGAKRRKYWST